MTYFKILTGLTVLLLVGSGVAQQRYELEIEVNGDEVAWQAEEPATKQGRWLVAEERAVVTFVGGGLELTLTDLGKYDLAHVLAAEFERQNDDRYTFRATVRHHDTGWDEYADAFRIVAATPDSSVDNGLRELLHPHVNEQPFTRSQTGVRARGTVRVEARDTVDGYGGSAIVIDLDAPPFAGQETGAVRYTVTPTAPE